jgi:3-oxoacyl-[acyl-carrier protein] reductase
MSVVLDGRTVVVTGSGGGLGAAYARALAAAGAAVVVNDVSAEAAETTVRQIVDAGGRATSVVAPVGTAEVAQQLVDTALSELGGFDAIVTNAGILRDKSILKMTDDDFDQVIQVHLRGTFTCARAAYASFKERGVPGRIVAIGSPTGQRGNFGQTNYAAAKAGIVGMIRTWALEMTKAGVTANAVIPVAATAMTKTIPYFAAAVEAADDGEPMPAFFRHELGFGVPEDVAGLVVYLASDAAQGITGQAIGAGGDRLQLWSHPQVLESFFHEGGWSADDIDAQLGAHLAETQQSVGEAPPPPLPAELERTPQS